MGMLAVNVDQVFADVLELLHGRGPAVDVGTRTARRFDDPAQQALALVAGEVVFPKVSRQRRNAVRREFGAHFGFIPAFAHQPGLSALAQHGSQRIDEDRFACAGFACQHGESGLEFQVEPVDDDKIADAECAQHGRFVIGGRRN